MRAFCVLGSMRAFCALLGVDGSVEEQLVRGTVEPMPIFVCADARAGVRGQV